MVTFAKKISGLFQVSQTNDERLKQFQVIYEENQAYVRRTIYSLVGQSDLDDLVQDVFVKIWLSMESFKGKSKLKTWLYRVAINTSYDWLRRHKRERDLQIQPLHEIKSDPRSEGVQTALETKQAVRQSILQLPEKLRSAFVLYYQEDFSVADIAETLEITVGTVKSRLSNSRKEMRSLLTKKGVIENE